MLRAVAVTGSFVDEQEQPVLGIVRFMPWALWIYHQNVRWATLAPEVVLDQDGRFTALLTATEGQFPWTYRAHTPAGAFEFSVPWRESGYTLRELIDEHSSHPRS